MKKLRINAGLILITLALSILMVAQEAAGQQTGKPSQAIPDDLIKIFTHSCTPCHTGKGSVIAKSMVNFDDWSKYSPDKQAIKAGKISSAVNSGFMPKKSEREKRPEIILTKEQIEAITKWTNTLNPPKK